MRYEDLSRCRAAGRPVLSAMYIRKSRTEEHLGLEETLSKHRSALFTYAAGHGFSVDDADVYEEVVSGESLFARPQMLRLLEAVAAGKYEAVLCMDMQRLGRGGMYDQGMILDTFHLAETLIVTPERIYDLTREIDEEAAEMQTFLSRSEYRMITKRLRRGLNQSLENGAYVSNAPFGYRQTTVGKVPTLEIVPEEAEVVRQIFRLYAEGDGCTRIEQAVNAMGVHGRRGSRFNRNTIRLILDNPVYIGKVRWNRTSTVRTGVGAQRQKNVVYNTPDKWRIMDGRHPAIIDDDLWETVQSRRKSRYFYVDNKHIASPLAGLVRCSRCGRLMNMQGKNKGTAYLLCATPGCCAGAKFQLVEEAILLQLRELAHDLELQLQNRQSPDVSGLEQSLRQAEERRGQLAVRRSRLYSLLEDGVYSREVFTQRMALLQADEEALEQHVQRLSTELRDRSGREQEERLARLRSLLELYEHSSVPVRKELLYSVVDCITYTKEKKSKPADFSVAISLL